MNLFAIEVSQIAKAQVLNSTKILNVASEEDSLLSYVLKIQVDIKNVEYEYIRRSCYPVHRSYENCHVFNKFIYCDIIVQ